MKNWKDKELNMTGFSSIIIISNINIDQIRFDTIVIWLINTGFNIQSFFQNM